MTSFNPVQVIIDKRDGKVVDASVIRSLIDSYTAGHLPDYQMSAFLMAAFLNGLDDAESWALTDAMLESGETVDLSSVEGIKVDKHSTGGVGDKISIALAPVVAACGVPVPMISGRGLGHSGGTLDKLESIPGFRTNLSLDEFRSQVGRLGVSMIGQTDEIAPADRKLYALRDVTGTVEYAPFITASIMSKKLAEGIDALVLDVKCGRGAFMQERARADELAHMIVDVAARFGKSTVAVLTRMDAPLGYAVGNWPEVREAVRCLKGDDIPDVTDLTLKLAGEMLALGGVVSSPDEGEAKAAAAIRSGLAFQKLADLVLAQGGDPWALDAERPHHVTEIEVRYLDGPTGYVTAIDAREVGYLAVDLGAGRRAMSERVDPGAGIVFRKRVGDEVEPGDLLATLSTNRPERAAEFERSLRSVVSVGEEPVTEAELFLGRFSG